MLFAAVLGRQVTKEEKRNMQNTRYGFLKKLGLLSAAMFAGPILQAVDFAPVQIDPVDVRWTFGAHEPYNMYRRIGRRTTGGLDGNARWVGQWLDWWDVHAPEKMEELGLNFLHSRFYKGMGWEVEKKDFPNVQKFVRNCHAHGVKALAYVQFATVYQEMMKKEVPDIDTWASIGLDGEKNTYSVAIPGSYYRWLPCFNCREWEDYLKRMCTIALTEGGFDGIMFDNVFGVPCYCPRCERLFREHLASIKNPSEHFGMDDLSDVAIPRIDAKWLRGTEIRDPVLQEWLTWRASSIEGVMARLYAHIKSVKPSAIVSGNPSPYRAHIMHVDRGQDMAQLCRHFDLIIMQNGNSPKVRPDGRIVNRVRDLKFAQDIGQRIVALSDTDARELFPTPEGFLLPMVEDIVFGGIPTDRTVMSPAREKGFINTAKFSFRKPLHDRFNAFAKSRRAEISAPTLRRVWLFYPTRSVYLSNGAHQGIAAAEEILLRNHVPYGYLVSRPGETSAFARCAAARERGDVLLVPGLTMLADEEIDALVSWAKSGGRLVVTGDSGRFDGWNAERFEDELQNRLKGLGGHVAVTPRSDVSEMASLGWTYSVPPPKDGGRALMADLASAGYKPPVEFRNLPPHVFAEYRTLGDGRMAVHLVNYALDKKVEGVSIDLHGASCDFSEPLREGDRPVAVGADGKLPAFRMYALLVVGRGEE